MGKTVTAHSVVQGTVVNTTDYLGGFQYQDNELQFFPTAEGYVSVVNGDKFNYVYNYTDHLGNIRVSYSLDQADQQIKILEENHYYSFGLKHSNYNNNTVHFDKDENGGIFAVILPVERSEYQYKYNGKELQDELGLNMYDYGARNYDPAIGRWMNIDPKAETSRRWSPYTYCYNNPMRFIDPDGMQADDWRNKAGQLVYNTDASKGTVGYTEHATSKDKELGSSLQQTKKGKEQFNKLVNSEHSITVIINETDKPKKNGDAILGKTVTPKEKNAEGKLESTITIYEENIAEYAGDIKAGAEAGNSVLMPLSNGKDLDVSNLTESQLTGAVFGEEIEHATPENIQLQHSGATRAEVEKIPGQVSDKILKQSVK